MNKQGKDGIEWCDYTWNPVSGCLHNCPYCYAARTYKRFNKSFEPQFHAEKLGEPAKLKKPSKIFVGSTTDLFGEWVPDEWIEQVFKACEAAPWHTYMFLTKNTDRYQKIINNGVITVKDNYWFGTTVTTPYGYSYARGQGINTFASIEPIMQEFNGTQAELLPDWVIIGAETGNRKGKVIPKKEWINNIYRGCKETGIPVFMKDSIKELMGDDYIQQWPEGLGVSE